MGRRPLYAQEEGCPFSNSKRDHDCLQFLVTYALEQRSGELKERTIDVEVFVRERDYDTGAFLLVPCASYLGRPPWIASGINGTGEIDYGIISRLISAEMGQPLITAGGVATFGTRAACKFFVDPRSLETAAAKLPPDWEHKNLQIVIRVRVLGNTTSPPQVVAVHTW